jgi:Domain of unknown function (DUF4190)
MPRLRSVSAPPEAPPPPPLPAHPSVQVAPYRPYNPWAIVSISFAGSTVIGTWLLGGVVAVVTGHVARHQIRRTGEAGSSLALAGLIIGYVAIGLTLAFIAAYVLFFVLFFTYVSRHPFPSPTPG